MEDKLRHAFDALQMPEACANRIEEELCKPTGEKKGYCAEPVQSTRGSWITGIAAAAALLAVVIAGSFLGGGADTRLSNGETVTEATVETNGEAMDAIQQELEDLKERLGMEEADFRFDQYFVVGEDGRVYRRYEAAIKTAPDFLEDANGRLYFVGSGEKIDITDEISLEKPYICFYTDANNTKQCLVIGRTSPGPYVDISNSVGWFSFYWADDTLYWLSGGGTHWSNWMNCEWPWLSNAVGELGFPWISHSEPETTAPPAHEHQDSHDHH